MTSPIWLTDRSRYETGTGRCPRQRYLTYHAGPTGYGYVRKGESLPLATGTYTHTAAAHLCAHLRDHDQLPLESVVRESIRLATTLYESTIEARGFRGLLASESTDAVLGEQVSLITGMIWAFRMVILPWLHQEFRVLEVENETIFPLTDQIGLMQRLDILAEKRLNRNLAYMDLKTTGRPADQWAEEWETKPQLALGTLGIPERYLGREVSELYVIGFNKGYRKKDSDDQIRQGSPFCYGYRRPANPPLAEEAWLPSYEWIDDQGQTKRAGREYRKAPSVEYPGGGEAWVRQLPDSVLRKQVFLVGPLNVQEIQLACLHRQIVGEEEKWTRLLWELYEIGQQYPWDSEHFQAQLDRLVPCSWNCRPFGARHQCEMVSVCFRNSGWQDPIGSGLYAARKPHHRPELEAAVARGLLPAEMLEAEEEEA